MLKTALSVIGLCVACYALPGCGGDDDLGSVDDYGGERQVEQTDQTQAPGTGMDPADEFTSTTQGNPGGGDGGGG